MYTRLNYTPMHDVSDKVAKQLAKATIFRHEGKPEKWAQDCEQKALKWMEWSYSLRHMFDDRSERPSVFPPSAYASNRKAALSVTPPQPQERQP